jgi:hypothetical protein
MPSFNDFVVLKRHRIQSSTNDATITIETSTEQSKPIRNLSKNRRATLIGIPPTLINTSTQDLQNNLHVQTSVFTYNEENFLEACYRTIEDIPAIQNNECLWIDVNGVSRRERNFYIINNLIHLGA